MSRSRAPEQATGAALPAERQLCEQFGVSRVTVREALRVLEANGLVEIRVGARGGTFVRAPSKERVGEGIADYLTMSSITSADVTELRMVLELGIIPLVCERATDDDIEELLKLRRQAQEALATDGYDVGMSAEFHTRVAQCAHNGAIELVLPLPAGPAADVAAGGQAGRSRDGQARGPGAPGLCGGGQGPGRGHRHQDHARPPGTDRRQGAARGAQEAVARQAVNGPAPCGAGER